MRATRQPWRLVAMRDELMVPQFKPSDLSQNSAGRVSAPRKSGSYLTSEPITARAPDTSAVGNQD